MGIAFVLTLIFTYGSFISTQTLTGYNYTLEQCQRAGEASKNNTQTDSYVNISYTCTPVQN